MLAFIAVSFVPYILYSYLNALVMGLKNDGYLSWRICDFSFLLNMMSADMIH